MKRGTHDHIKMKRLARVLGKPLYAANGLMERLWKTTADKCPRGNVGAVMTNDELAEELTWDGKPDDLVRALLECRWLDSHEAERLIIHDWPDHCEDSVHAHLARARLYFADGSEPKLSKLGLKEHEREKAETWYEDNRQPAATGGSPPPPLPLPLPLPLPSPPPQPLVAAGGSSESGFSNSGADDAVRALVKEHIAKTKATKAVEEHGVMGVTTILNYFHAERAKGWMRDPKAVLTSYLKNPEEKDFTRDDAGNLVPPSQVSSESRRDKCKRMFGGKKA